MTKDNVIVGPWENSSLAAPELSEEELKERETKRMKEDFQSIEILTESLIVQMIHSLKEHEFDISSTQFIRDVAFLNECVKSMLHREYGYEHPMTDLISKLFEVKKQGDKFLTKFAADKLAKVIKDL
jgi:hypothetical protein|tara:strand:+ start:543 stop:923 length:381 start_codon:yes stop_codon:yes gene_type:complete